jgi:hypothetical protein
VLQASRVASVAGSSREEKERLINISVVREWVGARGDGAEVVAIAPSRQGQGRGRAFFWLLLHGCVVAGTRVLG